MSAIYLFAEYISAMVAVTIVAHSKHCKSSSFLLLIADGGRAVPEMALLWRGWMGEQRGESTWDLVRKTNERKQKMYTY